MKAYVTQLGLKAGWNLIFRRKKGRYQPRFCLFVLSGGWGMKKTMSKGNGLQIGWP